MDSSDFEKSMPSSFLSPDVRRLLIDGGSVVQSDFEATRYFSKLGTFEWSAISDLLGNIEDDFDIHTQCHEWFTSAVGKLWPLFSATVDLLDGGELYMLEQFWELCAWTGKKDELRQQCHQLFSQGETTGVVELLLFTTAVLEHSLGKVYLLKGNCVPFLLRDLLSSQELKSVFGVIPVVFMQILFGTPLCLNLRNLVWHGFPGPDELRPHFATTLIVLVASVGRLLQAAGVSVLPTRQQVTNLHHVCAALDGCFPDLAEDLEGAVDMFRNSSFIAPCHKPTWEVILKHYIDSRYGWSLALLLPHLEQLLRCVFCWANRCSQRLLTAQTTEFYTTFDEILAEYIPCEGGDQINVIRQVLEDGMISLLLDVFTYQAGPRIRDKLSHGECEFELVPKILTNHVICLSLAIVCKVEKKINETASADQLELKEKFLEASEFYVSKFHSVSQLKETIIENIGMLVAWKYVPQPDPKEVPFLSWDEYFRSSDTLLELRSCLCGKIQSCRDIADECVNECVCSLVQAVKVETVYRPRSEATFVSLLRRIVDNVSVLCTQVCDVLQEKYDHYNTHKLRSRQRRTYHQIVSTCPSLYVAIQCVIILVVIQLPKINIVETLDELQCSHLSRFLKDILKFAENMVSCTNMEKNRWDVVQMWTAHFQQRVHQAIQAEVV